jgi:hypothetical protein
MERLICPNYILIRTHSLDEVIAQVNTLNSNSLQRYSEYARLVSFFRIVYIEKLQDGYLALLEEQRPLPVNLSLHLYEVERK